MRWHRLASIYMCLRLHLLASSSHAGRETVSPVSRIPRASTSYPTRTGHCIGRLWLLEGIRALLRNLQTRGSARCDIAYQSTQYYREEGTEPLSRWLLLPVTGPGTRITGTSCCSSCCTCLVPSLAGCPHIPRPRLRHWLLPSVLSKSLSSAHTIY